MSHKLLGPSWAACAGFVRKSVVKFGEISHQHKELLSPGYSDVQQVHPPVKELEAVVWL